MILSRIKNIPRAYRNLSILQFLFWSAFATSSYLAVFLQRQGYKSNQVGFINALISAVAIMATPFWGMIADKIQSIRKIFILCLSFGIVFWALIPVSSRVSIGPLLLIYVVVIITAFFSNPGYSLFDAFTVQRADIDAQPYGHIRLWGSFSFALTNFFLSLLLPHTGLETTFYLYGIVFLPLLVLMSKMKGADTGRQTGEKSFREMKLGRLFKNYYFITYLVFALIVYMPMSTLMVFMPYLIDAVGGDTARFGLLNACRAMVEIPILIFMRTLRRKIPLPFILCSSAVLFCLEAFLYTKAGNFYQVLAFQCLHGAAAGIMIGAASNYVYTLAPKGLNSTAHTVNGAVMASASIIGNLVGGFLIFNMGIFFYYRFLSVMLLFAFVYFAVSIFIGVKVLKKQIPWNLAGA